MDGYIRVSRVAGREGPAYISPSVQRDAIQRWADYRQVEIVAWHEDEDQSGGTQDRPGLRAAISRVEAKETDGIACWRLNRFARNVAGAIDDVKRIQAHGGHLAFVEEDIDPTGPFGSFILTILLAVATLERDNMIAGWDTAVRRAVERGVTTSPTPYGYIKGEDGRLLRDPIAAPHLVEAFHLAAAQGVSAALQYLLANAPDSRRWTSATVRRMLGYRSYLGEVRRAKIVNPAAHEPLVSCAIWEAAQHDPRPIRAKLNFPLSGIAVCGTCHRPLTGGQMGPGTRAYRCRATRSLFKGEKCTQGTYVVAERLESFVRDAVGPLLEGLRAESRDANTDTLTLAERALTEAEAELEAFAADLTMRRILGERYHDHLATRAKAVDDAKIEYRRLAQGQHARENLTIEDILEESDPRLFSQLLRSILTAIIVQPGHGNLTGRVRFIPIDNDLPPRPTLAADS
ncbi:MAG: recombinase family protein [Acidobacteriota bacterium]